MSADPALEANQHLVDRLIAEGALWSRPVIRAFRATPRHRFLDRVFQHQRDVSDWVEVFTRDPGPRELEILYSDRALITCLSKPAQGKLRSPISSSSQPSLMAEMLEDLNLEPGQRVLEIGAGTGYNAALMAYVVESGNVLSIDVDRSVLSEAWDHLRAFPERGVRLRHADGREPLDGEAPFDRLMVTAATPDIEPAWLEQLAVGGRLEAPVEFAPGLAFVLVGARVANHLEGRLTRAAYFMPLRKEGASGEESYPGEIPVTNQRVAAPWAGWFERRRSNYAWSTFVQALAFYGWLRGLTVLQRGLDDGGTFVLADSADNVCFLGLQALLVSGADGNGLAEDVFRAFLDAGGPRPWEFNLTVSATELSRSPTTDSFLRRGPRCWQRWDLPEHRRRIPEA